MNQTLLNSLSQMMSEQRNPRSLNIDCMTAIDIVQLINQEDLLVAKAVEKCLPHIAEAVEKNRIRIHKRRATCLYWCWHERTIRRIRCV